MDRALYWWISGHHGAALAGWLRRRSNSWHATYAGRAVVAKLNVDENPVTQRRYQIMSIPTLYIFKNGQVVDQIVGAQPLPVLQQRLARQVG